MGREGSVALVGAAAGPPGTSTGIHVTERSGLLAPQEAHCGPLQEKGAAMAPARQQARSNCPRYFPSHEPHETVLGGEEREHTSEVGVKARGPLCGLGSPGDSLEEFL